MKLHGINCSIAAFAKAPSALTVDSAGTLSVSFTVKSKSGEALKPHQVSSVMSTILGQFCKIGGSTKTY